MCVAVSGLCGRVGPCGAVWGRGVCVFQFCVIRSP